MSDESRREPAPAKKSKRGASAERMREITRARVAKRRERSETAGSSVPPIEVFVTDRQYLGLNPSPYQLTLLKAFYGRPLSPAELEIWGECTGGREYALGLWPTLALRKTKSLGLAVCRFGN